MTDEGSRLNPEELAALSDRLLEASTDLDRLRDLLSKATGELLECFMKCERYIESIPEGRVAEIDHLRPGFRSMVTTLQFPDMADQVLAHAVTRLHQATDRIASWSDPEDVEELVVEPDKLCPVTQNDMQAGSVELF